MYSNTIKVVGQPCENGCGGKYVKNPGTGKVFCENKCWLNSAPGGNQAPKSYNQAPRQQTTQGGGNFAQKQAIQNVNDDVEGRVRHGVSIAFIEAGAGLNGDTAKKINAWTRFIMTGHVDPSDIDVNDIF